MRRLVLVTLGLIAALGAALAADAARDQYRIWRISGELTGWEAAGVVGDDRLLARHVELVETLVDKYPEDPRLRFTAVKLLEWRAYLQRYSPRHARATLERAEHHLRHAVSLRPRWGRAWAAWLYIAARIDSRWNPELEHRFQSALHLGRYDLHSQYYLVSFVLEYWDILPPAAQSEGFEFLRETRGRHGLRQWLRDHPEHPVSLMLEDGQ